MGAINTMPGVMVYPDFLPGLTGEIDHHLVRDANVPAIVGSSPTVAVKFSTQDPVYIQVDALVLLGGGDENALGKSIVLLRNKSGFWLYTDWRKAGSHVLAKLKATSCKYIKGIDAENYQKHHLNQVGKE